MAERDARSTKEKLVGKRFTVFIYSFRGAGRSQKHIRRLLYGWSERRAGTGRFHKRGPYRGALSEQRVAAGRARREYSYRGILSGLFYWRPLPNAPVLAVRRKNAPPLASFFERLGVRFVQLDCRVRKIQDGEFGFMTVEGRK